MHSINASGHKYGLVYPGIQRASNRIANHVAEEIAAIGPYRLITNGCDLPVLAFTVAPEVTNYTVFDVSARMRESGWLVPAYTFPANREDLSVLRVVVRAGLTNDMADMFLTNLRKQNRMARVTRGSHARTTPRGARKLPPLAHRLPHVADPDGLASRLRDGDRLRD